MLRGPRWRLWQSGILGNGVLSARHVARGSRDLASARRPAARRWASSKSLHGDQFCWPSRDRHRGKLCRLALRASNLTSCSQTGQSTAADDAPTIYALSSGPGRAGVAVIRISGSRALDVSTVMHPELVFSLHGLLNVDLTFSCAGDRSTRPCVLTKPCLSRATQR